MVPLERILPFFTLVVAVGASEATESTDICPSQQHSTLFTESARFRDEVRPILNEHCGSCHNSNQKTAPAAALNVYDLKEEDWPARMTLSQIPKLNGRMKNKGTSSQRAKVARFVEIEVKKRKGAL